MTHLNNINTGYALSSRKEPDAPEESFNDKVLSYIQQNKPHGTLNELLERMKTLSPDKPVSLQALDNALLYADTALRNTDKFKNYTDNVLDRECCQLIGVTMLYNNMLYDGQVKKDDNV